MAAVSISRASVPIFRHGVQTLLGSAPGLAVVGEARTGQEAIDLAASLQPDIIRMDLQMPQVNGIEATRQILAASPEVRILMVTMFEDDASVFTAMKAGARGYVLKDAEKPEMLRAITAVGNGEAIFSPAIASRVLDYFTAPRPARAATAFPNSPSANSRSSTSSPRATGIRTSPGASCLPTAPCGTTSPASSASCRSPTGRRPSSAPRKPDWASRHYRCRRPITAPRQTSAAKAAAHQRASLGAPAGCPGRKTGQGTAILLRRRDAPGGPPAGRRRWPLRTRRRPR